MVRVKRFERFDFQANWGNLCYRAVLQSRIFRERGADPGRTTSCGEPCLKPLTKRDYDEFRQCADYGQIYWKGSHNLRVQSLIEEFGAVGPEYS